MSPSRRHGQTPGLGLGLAAALVLGTSIGALAACSGDESSAPATTTVPVTTAPEGPGPVLDDQLSREGVQTWMIAESPDAAALVDWGATILVQTEPFASLTLALVPGTDPEVRVAVCEAAREFVDQVRDDTALSVTLDGVEVAGRTEPGSPCETALSVPFDGSEATPPAPEPA